MYLRVFQSINKVKRSSQIKGTGDLCSILRLFNLFDCYVIRTEALLRIVTPGLEYVVSPCMCDAPFMMSHFITRHTLLLVKTKQKKVFAKNLVGFRSQSKRRPKKGLRRKFRGLSQRMWMETHRIETKSLHYKLLELWFHMIKSSHPKMVTSGAGRPLPP